MTWRGVIDALSQLDAVFGGQLRKGARRLYDNETCATKGAPRLGWMPYSVVHQDKGETLWCVEEGWLHGGAWLTPRLS